MTDSPYEGARQELHSAGWTLPGEDAIRRVGQAVGDAARGFADMYLESHRFEIDRDEGRVIVSRYPNGAVQEAILVRKGLEERSTREAVIAELGRLGYVVTPPEYLTGKPGVHWFADVDEEADPPYVWQPCLETGEGLVPHFEIWFDSKERCEDWIREYLVGTPLETD